MRIHHFAAIILFLSVLVSGYVFENAQFRAVDTFTSGGNRSNVSDSTLEVALTQLAAANTSEADRHQLEGIFYFFEGGGLNLLYVTVIIISVLYISWVLAYFASHVPQQHFPLKTLLFFGSLFVAVIELRMIAVLMGSGNESLLADVLYRSFIVIIITTITYYVFMFFKEAVVMLGRTNRTR